MRNYLLLVLVSVVVLGAAACTAKQADQGQGAPEFRTTATIKDIMDSMVDPGSDVIWDSVETVVRPAKRMPTSAHGCVNGSAATGPTVAVCSTAAA